jgi:membrane associated rhomboid family serine protease
MFPESRIMMLIPPIPLPARVFVLLYAILELTLGVTSSQAGVAHFAHLGGLIGGWLVYKFGRA